MSTAKRIVISAAGILLIVSIVCAQEQTPASSITTITAAATADRVRFTAPSTIVQMRLEVYGANGEKLFDNEIRGGNVIDWLLQDGRAERLPDGSYLCVVTSKSISGRMSQKLGEVRIENAAASVKPIDTRQLTAQQTQAVGPLEENASLTVLKEGETQTTTVIAHNGEEGQITRGRGALSFRIGDFYSGKDTEQMRLTAEGNLGIGITNPQARLDVDGVIRASQGIIFPDGTTQYSAASRTLGAKSTMPDQVSDQILGGKHKFHAESVTQNQIAKFMNGGGTLGDSVITETASGDVGIGTAAPGGVLDLQRNNAGDILQRFWNTGSGGAKLRYVAATGATSQVQLTDLQEWLMSIAGNNTVGMQFRVRDTTDPNTEAGLSAAARMTILRNGNVGIGTTTPGAVLHVMGEQPATVTGGDGANAAQVLQILGGNGGNVFPNFGNGGNGGGVLIQAGDGGFSVSRFGGNGGSITLQPGNRGAGDVNPVDPVGNVLLAPLLGKVGIGTTAPAAKLQVVGGSICLGPYCDNSNGRITAGGASGEFTFLDRGATSFVDVPSNGERWLWYGIGGRARLWSGGDKLSVDPSGALRVAGTVTASTTPDIAETIAADPSITAADVVCADPLHRERAIRCSKNDRAILGVISDGTGGFLINSNAKSTDAPLTGMPLVLAGRVPVKVSLENGPIQIGDFLTTSSTLGIAMRASEPGPTIGIALEAFNPETKEAGAKPQTGTVLCFIKAGEADIRSTLARMNQDNKRLQQQQQDQIAALRTANTVLNARLRLIERTLKKQAWLIKQR
jgi:hypothetical protein